MLVAHYSYERNVWCVYDKESTTMRCLWKCRTKEDAEELAKKVSNGARICKGNKSFGTACGSCVKCLLTEEG